MIRIYIDCIKFDRFKYIEDDKSSYEIIQMDKDTFVDYIKEFCGSYGEVHTCYDTFICHVGRFRRNFGKDWFGEELCIYALEYPSNDPNVIYRQYDFNDKGQLVKWPYGIFG